MQIAADIQNMVDNPIIDLTNYRKGYFLYPRHWIETIKKYLHVLEDGIASRRPVESAAPEKVLGDIELLGHWINAWVFTKFAKLATKEEKLLKQFIASLPASNPRYKKFTEILLAKLEEVDILTESGRNEMIKTLFAVLNISKEIYLKNLTNGEVLVD